MSTKKDYYELLGISKSATPEQIKDAFRKLAREHHPDVASADKKEAAEKKFKEINEAYQVLSDPEKKKMYDQYGHTAQDFGAGGPRGGGYGGFGGNAGQWGPFSYSYSSSGGGNPFGADFDPFDVFADFFGGARAPRHGRNLQYEMHIDFVDAVRGLEKEISIESGQTKISIPAGIYDGAQMRFQGKGMPGPNGTPPGDLFITFRIKKPKEFDIDGENLYVVYELDFIQAALGAVIDVPCVDINSSNGLGKVKLNIPAGTQYGTKFAIRGKGMPKLKGKGQGDILVQVTVSIPKKLSKKQKDLLEEFKRG